MANICDRLMERVHQMDADLASRTAPLILSWDDYLDLRNWWHTALAPHTAPDPPFSAEFMGHPLVVVNG